MVKDFTDPKVVESYDEHIRKLIPGYELIHMHIQAILKFHLNAQKHPKILIAGCGTGYELSYLLHQFPHAEFVAIDPSSEMLSKAKQRFENTKAHYNIEFIVGDTSSLSSYPHQFDVALAVLVSHFLNLEHKKKYYKEIYQSLNKQGMLLSYDLIQFQNPEQGFILQNLTEFLGLSTSQSQKMLERIEDDFHLIGLQDLQTILRNCGYQQTSCFAQFANFYAVQSYKSVLN